MALKRGSKQLVADAMQRIDTISVDDAREKLDDPSVLFVDIREPGEFAQGAIPGAFNAPRGLLEFWIDPESPAHKQELDGKRLVLYCQTAGRSALAAAALADMGVENVSHIAGGYAAWKQAEG